MLIHFQFFPLTMNMKGLHSFGPLIVVQGNVTPLVNGPEDKYSCFFQITLIEV